jgi:hypothetical protein
LFYFLYQLEEHARKQEKQEAELRTRLEREKEAAEQRIWERLQMQNQVNEATEQRTSTMYNKGPIALMTYSLFVAKTRREFKIKLLSFVPFHIRKSIMYVKTPTNNR